MLDGGRRFYCERPVTRVLSSEAATAETVNGYTELLVWNSV